ncbi:hypothetical protein [Rhodococcus sp. BP22]|uniref:hypothetical protein n=1 Tax=Rhodococcus sp. BP22 TaxID=2758566 RepID=UPI0016472407|nr:hypothetical protein [Rhodococcus sp. BP22]
MTDDVGKRWHDPGGSGGVRRAALFTVSVIVSALVVMVGCIMWAAWGPHSGQCRDAAFTVCAEPERTILLVVPSALLLIGGLFAFVQTYRVWRSGGTWPIWQGAGWALLVSMVIYMSMSLSALSP